MNADVPGALRAPGTVSCVVSMIAASVWAENSGTKTSDVKTRVGTYDSRAIAVAFVGSPAFSKWMSDLKAEREQASAAGDQKRVAELDAEGKARQNQIHKQGFSTAPVDNILAQIKDQLPEIAKKAGVGPIVSKWDRNELSNYPSAELVDVTMALVEALHPNNRQLKTAKDIQKTKPVSLEQIEKLPAEK